MILDSRTSCFCFISLKLEKVQIAGTITIWHSAVGRSIFWYFSQQEPILSFKKGGKNNFDRVNSPASVYIPLNGTWLIVHHYFTKVTDFVILCLLSCTPSPFWKGVYSKRKEFLSFSSRPLFRWEGKQKERILTVASLESLFIPLNPCPAE